MLRDDVGGLVVAFPDGGVVSDPDPPAAAPASVRAEDVEAWLVASFVSMAGVGLQGGPAGSLLAVGVERAPGTFDVVKLSEAVLGRKSLPRQVLLTWASVTAGRRLIERGIFTYAPAATIPGFCERHGISRNTFDRHRRRAAELIAAAWAAAPG